MKEFWKFWFKHFFKGVKITYTYDLPEGQKIDKFKFQEIEETSLRPRDFEGLVSGNSYPDLKRMYCWQFLAGDDPDEYLENLYAHIGFLGSLDSALLEKKKEDGKRKHTIKVLMREHSISFDILEFYFCNHSNMNRALRNMQHDFEILKGYLIYSATEVVENILKNTLTA